MKNSKNRLDRVKATIVHFVFDRTRIITTKGFFYELSHFNFLCLYPRPQISSIDLSQGNGHRHVILGPMELPVPQAFFSQALNTDDVLASSHSLNFQDFLLLEGELVFEIVQDGSTFNPPVVVSIEYEEEAFQNYILKAKKGVPFTIAGFDQELVELSANRRNDSSFVPTIRVLSGQPFQVKLLSQTRGVTSEQILAVQAPTTQTAPSPSREGCFDCYIGGNTTPLPVTIINDETGESVDSAYIGISNTTFQLVSPSQYKISNKLTVYSPLPSTAFHGPIGVGWAEVFFGVDSTVCLSSVDQHRGFLTKHYSSAAGPCPNSLQKHRWWGIPEMLYCGSNASVQAVEGCQTGLTWTVIPMF